MSPALAFELHLAVNHLPVLGLPFAAGLLAAGLALDNAQWRRAGLWTAVLAAFAVWLVYVSGGAAGDAAETLTGVSDRDLGLHAAAAWRFAWAVSGVGLAAAAALFARPPGRKESAAVLVLALAASAAGGWTAHLGGRIRHPELRGDSSAR
jgi:hypothetical protein